MLFKHHKYVLQPKRNIISTFQNPTNIISMFYNLNVMEKMKFTMKLNGAEEIFQKNLNVMEKMKFTMEKIKFTMDYNEWAKEIFQINIMLDLLYKMEKMNGLKKAFNA